MGKRSRNTGAREERNLAAQLPGARKVSRSSYTGPDVEWRGRHIEAKYRTDGFTTLYRWLRDVQILDFLDSVRGRARVRARPRVGSSSLPGPALVLVREKGVHRYRAAGESHICRFGRGPRDADQRSPPPGVGRGCWHRARRPRR